MIFLFLFLLVPSLVANVILFWYAKKKTSDSLEIVNWAEDIIDELLEYGSTVKAVHQLHDYYGDDIIKNLIRKTDTMSEKVTELAKALVTIKPDENNDEESGQ